MIRIAGLRRASVQRLVVPFLVVLSTIMILLSKIDQVMFESLRIAVTDRAAPMLDVMAQPFGGVEYLIDRARAIVSTYQDNVRLTEENKRLLQWQQAALTLASEDAQLRALLRLSPESGLSYVTARVIATSGGAYLHNLTVNAGSRSGIARGQAAITGEGLVGRVYEVGAQATRILLITDLNSRIPVIVERSRQRAILAGDNSENPSLIYLEPAVPVRNGDRIVTSGEGGVFPPGLPVGVVEATGGGPPKVEPYVELSQVEYLRVVDYGLAGGLPKPIAPAPSLDGSRVTPRGITITRHH